MNRSIIHVRGPSVHGACTTLIWLCFVTQPMSTRNPLDNLFARSLERPSDLLCCAFGLRTSEIDAYFTLISGPKTVEEIAAIIKRDRSTVQRVLKKLLDSGLAIRERRFLSRGGYYFVYRAVSEEVVKSQILSMLEQWYHRIRRIISESWPAPTHEATP